MVPCVVVRCRNNGVFYCKKVNNLFFRDFLFVAVVLLGGICTRIVPFELPFTVDSSLIGAGLFYSAYRLRDKWNSLQHYASTLSQYKLALLSVIVFVCIMLHETINLRVCWVGIIPVFWYGNALMAIFLLWLYAKRIMNYTSLNGLCCTLEYIGKNSIVYLCLNQLVIMIIEYYISDNKRWVITFLTLCVLSICSYIINHSKLRILIGKYYE